MRKEVGWQRYHSKGLPISYPRWNFQTNLFSPPPHPVRGLKLLSEFWFYYLQTITVSQHRVKNCWRYLNKNIHNNKIGGFFKAASPIIAMTPKQLLRCYQCRWGTVPLPKIQTSWGFVVLLYLKRFLMGSRFFPSSQISGRMYNTLVSINWLSVWSEKCVAVWYYAVI